MQNYKKLIENNPTIYKTIINQLGQSIYLVEHPFKGDEVPVIAVYHKEKIAAYTDFFDTEDFYIDSEYNPIYIEGKIICFYEI